MRARLRAWWQKVKQYRLLPIGVIVVLLAFTLAVWRFGWDWTGFNGGYSQVTTTRISHGTTTTTEKPPGKTLWDLLQLLIIPLMLAIGGFWLNQLQKSREKKAIEQQAEVERKAAEKRAQTEREIASDNQREAALEDYIDKMSELLLKEHLRESGADAEARKIARVRTLAMLPRLDGKRKRTLLLFLYESNLIARDKPIIELARNKTKELTRELNRDNSVLASIKDKSLIESIELTKDESIIELKGADLSEADLERTNLYTADLSEANLEAVTGIAIEELEKKASSLKGATLPDGSKHP